MHEGWGLLFLPPPAIQLPQEVAAGEDGGYTLRVARHSTRTLCAVGQSVAFNTRTVIYLGCSRDVRAVTLLPVSYTHLTLPTKA